MESAFISFARKTYGPMLWDLSDSQILEFLRDSQGNMKQAIELLDSAMRDIAVKYMH